jgi:hypothetical protein
MTPLSAIHECNVSCIQDCIVEHCSLSGGKERTSPLPRLSVGSTGTVEEGRIRYVM